MQRRALELRAALLAHAEPVADLLVRLGVVVVQPVAADEHLAVALGQQPQHRGQLPVVFARDGALQGVDRPDIGHVAGVSRY